ncbi:MAG: protein kinase [Gemmataceae bacterium]|nr:protein kinase [Gemmataceae bacterium]
MSLELHVIAGPDKGRTFVLNTGAGLMLGRSAQAQYQLNDPRVSRNHCAVVLEEGVASVVCNGGSGGTMVNGQKAEKQKLKPGDVVQVGDTQLRLVLGDAGAGVAEAQSAGAKAAPAKKADNLEALVGGTISHYALNLVIGTGRSSVVFHATDTKDDKPVALKVLQPEFSSDPEEMERFVRAVKTMLPIRHANLVTLCAAGKTGPHCWVAMEYVAGENLTQVIGRIGVAGMLDWRHAFKAAVHIGRALEHVHALEIIHRNVTPTNILLEATTKTAKLGDLMLAKALEGVLAKQVTRPGEIIGDVEYMSPERTRGTEGIDGRSDLYGLGATLYGLLTGRPPLQGTTLVEKITRIRTAEPEKPKKYQMSIPDRFQDVVLKLLAKRPEDRYQSAADMLKELSWIGKLNGMADV